MSYFKERVFSFIDDKLQLSSLVGFLGLAVFSLLNYFSAGSSDWLARCIVYGAGVILILFLSNRGAWIAFYLVANVMIYFSKFSNVTYFVITVMLITFYPKTKIFLLIQYGVNVFILCHLHKLPIMALGFHVCSCLFVFYTMQVFNNRVNTLINNTLRLASDELIILDYLCKGIKQNDIPDFSAQTVSRKLRQAKIRNGIGKTSELLERYKKEKEQALPPAP